MDFEELNSRAEEQRPESVVFEANQVLADAITEPGDVPDWIQLTPGRGVFEGRDGRKFRVKAPNKLVREFRASSEHLQLDVDHMSEFSLNSSASGWVTDMAVRNGGEIWAKVEFTPQGEQLVRDREFRGVSPTFAVSRESAEAFRENGSAMEVIGFFSVALTNRPNLKIRSLNTTGAAAPEKGKSMDPKILQMLGLPEDTGPEAVANAVAELKEKAEKEPEKPAPDLNSYVPRADYDATVKALNSKVEALQAEREADRKAAHDREVNATIEGALKARKISPATEGYHRQCCSTPEGLEAFRKFIGEAPAIVPEGETAPQASGSAPEAPKLTDAQRALCAHHGWDPEKYLESMTELQERGVI